MEYLPRPNSTNSYYNAFQHHKIDTNSDGVFVFGSNLKGIHGAGAAKEAHRYYGAKYGIGVGFQGSSYAIPTKDQYIQTLPLSIIKKHVKDFIEVTHLDEETWYFVTPVGCGLAGYLPSQIAPLFKGVVNCWLPHTFKPYLTNKAKT